MQKTNNGKMTKCKMKKSQLLLIVVFLLQCFILCSCEKQSTQSKDVLDEVSSELAIPPGSPVETSTDEDTIMEGEEQKEDETAVSEEEPGPGETPVPPMTQEPTSTPTLPPLPIIDFNEKKIVNEYGDIYHVVTIDFDEIAQKLPNHRYRSDLEQDYDEFTINRGESGVDLDFATYNFNPDQDETILDDTNTKYALKISRESCTDEPIENNCPPERSEMTITVKLPRNKRENSSTEDENVDDVRIRDIIIYYSFHNNDKMYKPLEETVEIEKKNKNNNDEDAEIINVEKERIKVKPRESYFYISFNCTNPPDNPLNKINFGPYEASIDLYNSDTVYREGWKTAESLGMIDKAISVKFDDDGKEVYDWRNRYFFLHVFPSDSTMLPKFTDTGIMRRHYPNVTGLKYLFSEDLSEVSKDQKESTAFFSTIPCLSPFAKQEVTMGVKFLTQGSVELRIYKIIIITEEVESYEGT